MPSPTQRDVPAHGPQRFNGGPVSLKLIARLLGLDGSDLGTRVRRIAWLEDHLEVEIDLDEGGELTLIVEASKGAEQSRPFLTTGPLDLWYRGDTLPDALEASLRSSALVRRGVSLEHIHDRLLQDPDRLELPPELQSPEPDSADPDADPALAHQSEDREPQLDHSQEPEREKIGTWDPDTTYADFFALETLELMPYEPIEAANPFVRISHSDLECLSFMPGEKTSNAYLVDFPWIAALASGNVPAKFRETTLCTDLTEHAVIMGCNNRVRQVLDHVIASGLDKPIIFTNTCLPATTSEDVMSVLRRYRQSTRLKVVSHNRAETEFDEDMLEGLLVDRRLQAQREVAPQADSVNLIGFSRDKTLDELTGLLGELGIAVNTAILPEVDETDMERYPRAALDVFWRTARHWEHFYRQLKQQRQAPAIEPPGPVGVAGTRAWLQAVAQALDLHPDLDAIWDRHFDPLRAEWERITRTASELCIGLVIRPKDLVCLEDPGCTNGIPILAVLEELGFGLEILIQANAPADRALQDRVGGLLARPGEHRIAFFDSQADLRAALAHASAQAVFSNFTFDWRLTEAGKNRISLRHFCIGLDGALETGRRLVRACQVPFRQRYRRYLARTGMGLRPPVEE